MKKMDKKAFTLIELLVVIAVVGILVLLAAPRFTGYTQKAEEARIQHDVKVMEEEVGTVFINGDDEFNEWENNMKDLNQLAQDNELFEKEGYATELEPTDGHYKIIPEKYKDKINTKLKGTFYANSHGKVYYEHTKPLFEIPAKPEKAPGYSDEEINDLVYRHEYIPVATAEELNSIRNGVPGIYGEGTKWKGTYEGGLGKHYVQVKDIDLAGYSGGEGWAPIGTFTGTYDGGNYVITDLEVKGDGKNFQGLFGRTAGATISNVALEDVKVTGGYWTGGLVGWANYKTVISNSYTTGSVEGSSWVGGLVGDADGSSTISNSYSTGPVTGNGNVGGLVGRVNDSIIENSYATGAVIGSGDDVGGLAGWVGLSAIRDSYSTGEVTGNNYVGGLVGEAEYSTIINISYATGSVKGNENVGGLLGATNTSRTNYQITISNSYATGPVEGIGSNVGGLLGWTYSGTTISNSYTTGPVTGANNVGGLVGIAVKPTTVTVTNSYWDKDTTRQSTSAGGATGMTTEAMKDKNTYLDWNFDTVWKIDDGKYPTLR